MNVFRLWKFTLTVTYDQFLAWAEPRLDKRGIWMRVGRRTCHEEGMVRGCVPGAGMSHGLAFVTNSRHLSEGKTWASATHQPEPLPPQKSE